MIIKQQWRILTVGDGDLSFSHSLNQHHQPQQLTATVFDSEEVMTQKYTENALLSLREQNIPVLFNFDVTNRETWFTLPKQQFDAIIFQFPLLPGFKSYDEYQDKVGKHSVNTLNRYLLRTFLKNAFQYFLDPQGEQLCFITSKDVSPYREWNIENSLHVNTDFHYLGSSVFNIQIFPEYKVRNVDRDKHVRDTRGTTYVWSLKENHSLKNELDEPTYQDSDCCHVCGTGPFTTSIDKDEHNASKKHQQMMQFEAQWLDKINQN